MSRKIDLVFEYPHEPSAVWTAITDPRILANWLMPNDFEPRAGHRFTFTTTPRPGFDGIVRCEVKAVEPPRRLVYTWGSSWGSDATVLTWSLEPIAGGTRLRLEHAGFHGVKGLFLSLMMRSGWRKKLGKVVPGLLGGHPHRRVVTAGV